MAESIRRALDSYLAAEVDAGAVLSATAKVSHRGQTSLPAELRHRWGIQEVRLCVSAFPSPARHGDRSEEADAEVTPFGARRAPAEVMGCYSSRPSWTRPATGHLLPKPAGSRTGRPRCCGRPCSFPRRRPYSSLRR
jgi:hypothetical protein